MVAAPDLGSGAVRRGGSSPFTRTHQERFEKSNLSFLFSLSSNFGIRFLRCRGAVPALSIANAGAVSALPFCLRSFGGGALRCNQTPVLTLPPFVKMNAQKNFLKVAFSFAKSNKRKMYCESKHWQNTNLYKLKIHRRLYTTICKNKNGVPQKRNAVLLYLSAIFLEMIAQFDSKHLRRYFTTFEFLFSCFNIVTISFFVFNIRIYFLRTQ